MRIHTSSGFSTGVVMTILCAVTALASNHHSLNGTWTLVPAKSDFAGQASVQTGTVTINDREGNISISRDFTYGGAVETFFYSFSTDGRENSTIHNGKDFKSKAKWEHDTLKVTTTQEGVVTSERYSLAPDGTLTVNVAVPGLKPITLAFQRQ
jgi:hypothetical protein